MTSQQITVRPLTESDISAVAELMIAQQTRLHALDDRLESPRPSGQIVEALAKRCRTDPTLSCGA